MDRVAEELRLAASRGDAFAALCARDARSFRPLIEQIKSKHSFGPERQLMAFVDYAMLPEFSMIAEELKLQPHPLVGPNAAVELRQNAGHLVVLPDSESFESVFRLIWGRKAGLFIQTACLLPAILEHLQSLIVALRADGEAAIFRFYDPRVFSALLETSTEEQFKLFFDGKIEAAFFENDGSEMCVATFGPTKQDIDIQRC